MEFGHGRHLVGLSVAVCALVALGAASASASKPLLSGGNAVSSGSSAAAVESGGWGAGVEAVLPANAAVSKSHAVVESVSCPSDGNCTAVGNYTDSSGNLEGLLLTETAGSWAPGVEAVLPANANPKGLFGASVGSVSCASAGNCTAVGAYAVSGFREGLLLTETAGGWSAGVEAALPANADSSRQWVQLSSVSCASAGNCTAVGLYQPVRSTEGLLLTETDGSWSAGVEAVPPVPNSDAQLNSVSCSSAGSCTAVGAYYVLGSGADQGLLLTETAGSWAPGIEAALPADNTNHGADLTSVSCASAGNCTAVGLYDLDFSNFPQPARGKGVLLTETAGSWAIGVEAVLPADAVGPDAVDDLSPPMVSCSSAGNCSAAGSYHDNSSGMQGLLLTETAGSWASGIEALPADNGSYAPSSVSCTSDGNCGARVGRYLLTETAGSWATGVEPSLPANAAPGRFLLDAVSCASPGTCTAVGSYSDNSGNEFGLLIGGSPPTVRLDISKNGTGSGTVSSLPTGIDCGPTCSASFDAATSLTLTATPSPGSRFSGWSGGGCKGTGSCQPDTGISEQTVRATFNLPPKCVVPKLRDKTLKVAKHAIRTRNCALGRIKYAASRTIKRGLVISQKPKEGRRLNHGAKVSLLVSTGRR